MLEKPRQAFPSVVHGACGVDDERSNKLKQFVRQTVPSIAGLPAVDMAKCARVRGFRPWPILESPKTISRSCNDGLSNWPSLKLAVL